MSAGCSRVVARVPRTSVGVSSVSAVVTVAGRKYVPFIGKDDRARRLRS
jgi:hypothetical protein